MNPGILTGTQLRALRNKFGLTQDKLAEAIGLESENRRAYISHLESSDDQPLPKEASRRILAALKQLGLQRTQDAQNALMEILQED